MRPERSRCQTANAFYAQRVKNTRRPKENLIRIRYFQPVFFFRLVID